VIKTVLAIVEGQTSAKAFVEAVLAIADHRQSHLIFDILTAAPLMSPRLAPLGTLYTLPGEMRQLADSHIDSLRALLPPGIKAELVSHFDDVGWIPGDLRTRAPLADLIIIGPREGWAIDWLRRRTIETLLLSSGTPILLLPPGRTLGAVNHALLGWKPGAAATRTLHDLANLAAPGARIDIVSVKHGLGEVSKEALDPVVAILERQGFRVEGHVLDHGETPEDSLGAFALERGADVLAVGGFAHSRVREIVLGGVTESLIENPRLPILMAH
jgi:nucleotide-binding universal stress UspA family protein